jgi:hypothetical protein
MAKRKNTGNPPNVPATRESSAEISSLAFLPTLEAARAQLWSTTCDLLHAVGEERCVQLRTVLNAHAALYGRAS